ncbi:ABC transporter permease subunit [Chelativorans sp.]|uniref:ABC transporter permease subunit n=1 Tax=Chelativorans sp. TaxID=2203393 RepID=UPI0028123011|nr:ABC transporter permease subunit [Chelativorans sp.]
MIAASWQIFRRDLMRLVANPGTWVMMAAMTFAATLVLRNLVSTFDTESVLVSTLPGGAVAGGLIAVAAMLAAIHTATAIAAEQENGTLEVLFAGPVNAADFAVAKMLRGLAVAALLVAPILYQLAAIGLLSNLMMGWRAALLLVLAVPLCAPAIGLGLVISSLCRSARAAVVLSTGFFAFLILLHLSFLRLAAADPAELDLFAHYLREAALGAAPVLSWLSPVDYVAELAQELRQQSLTAPWAKTAAALAYASLCTAAAAIILRFRGAAS